LDKDLLLLLFLVIVVVVAVLVLVVVLVLVLVLVLVIVLRDPQKVPEGSKSASHHWMPWANAKAIKLSLRHTML
jgi:hypothetical protein